MVSRFRLLCLMLTFLTGCAHKRLDPRLASADLPRGGEPIETDVFSMLSAQTSEEPAVQITNYWPLPQVARKYRIDVKEGGEEIVVSDYSMIALGIPYAYLPIQFSFSRYVYTEAETEPRSETRRRYLPWKSWKTQEGTQDPGLQADVQGIPVLYEHGTETGTNWYFEDFSSAMNEKRSFSFWTALWWIGPVYFDDEVVIPQENGGETILTGTYFFPLFLGRAPGALLWMSGDSQRASPSQTIESRFHGPLAGYAGYHTSRVTAGEDKDSFTRLLLGGLLWYDSATGTPDSESRNRISGPLWGLFGGGLENGRGTIYLLRIPI